MLADLFENEKPLYKNLIENLAKQRKLRPVFVERKPRAERFAWIKEALGRKQNEADRRQSASRSGWSAATPRCCAIFWTASASSMTKMARWNKFRPSPTEPALEAAVSALLDKYDPALSRFTSTRSRRWMKTAGRCSTKSSLLTRNCSSRLHRRCHKTRPKPQDKPQRRSLFKM